jgi:hypothetical protein
MTKRDRAKEDVSHVALRCDEGRSTSQETDAEEVVLGNMKFIHSPDCFTRATLVLLLEPYSTPRNDRRSLSSVSLSSVEIPSASMR